jgi:hypothetical protein
LPGLIDIQIGSPEQFLLRAGGALARTVLVYRFNPPDQVAHFVGDPKPAKMERRTRKKVPPLPPSDLPR